MEAGDGGDTIHKNGAIVVPLLTGVQVLARAGAGAMVNVKPPHGTHNPFSFPVYIMQVDHND